MAFTSVNFIIFLIISTCAYFFTPKNFRWIILLLASYVFYLCSSPKSFVFVVITTITTYIGGRLISGYEYRYKDVLQRQKATLDKEHKKVLKETNNKKKRRILFLVVLLNFGILAFVKYFRVYLDSLGTVMGWEWIQFDSGILIPLGISFYTFQSMSYIIDIYRGKYEAETNLAKFALFVSFFPQIIQGPISRYDQLAGQLYKGHTFDFDRARLGIELILWGWFKKLIIADRIGILVDTVFDNYTEYQGLYLIVAVTGYTIQIYADFSGGMDIARGVSQILGIDLVKNFERPYFAKSIPEFWRRWHITLGSWCRDYIFYPLSLSKGFGKLGKKSRNLLGMRTGKLLPVIFAQIITFFIIGLWHGADLKYIVFGFYHGAFMILGTLFEPQIQKLTALLRINTTAFSWTVFQIVRTFVLVVIGRFFSRAVSFSAALSMMKNSLVFNPTVLFNGGLYNLGLSDSDFTLLFFCLLFWFVVSLIQERGYSVRQLISQQNLIFRWIIYFAGAGALLIFGIYGIGYDASAFIYRGF